MAVSDSVFKDRFPVSGGVNTSGTRFSCQSFFSSTDLPGASWLFPATRVQRVVGGAIYLSASAGQAFSIRNLFGFSRRFAIAANSCSDSPKFEAISMICDHGAAQRVVRG